MPPVTPRTSLLLSLSAALAAFTSAAVLAGPAATDQLLLTSTAARTVAAPIRVASPINVATPTAAPFAAADTRAAISHARSANRGARDAATLAQVVRAETRRTTPQVPAAAPVRGTAGDDGPVAAIAMAPEPVVVDAPIEAAAALRALAAVPSTVTAPAAAPAPAPALAEEAAGTPASAPAIAPPETPDAETLEVTGSLVEAELAVAPEDGFRIEVTEDSSLTVQPVVTDDAATEGISIAGGEALLYANTDGASDTIVRPTPIGIETFTVVRDATAPEAYSWTIELDGDETLRITDDGGAEVVDGAGAIVTVVPTPWSVDAEGIAVPTRFSVDGDVLTMHVAHAAATVAYPVTADPWFIPVLAGAGRCAISPACRSIVHAGTVGGGPIALAAPAARQVARGGRWVWANRSWAHRRR